MKRRMILVVAMCSVCFAAYSAQADGVRGIDIDFVTIGNAGNPWDTQVMETDGTAGYGDVSYEYRIGKYEITNGQWDSFVTAAGAPTGNPSEAYGRSTYWTGDNIPTTGVSWYEAAQFCNYLTSGDKSQGAYRFSGDNLNPGDFEGIDRDSAVSTYGIAYVIPTEDEWHKAAYYTGSDYSIYANGTDTAPIPGDDTNYDKVIGQPWDVGAGTMEQNGTFDMMGNVWEWNETLLPGSVRGVRGGYYYDDDYLRSSHRNYNAPYSERDIIGFRVASVPEPCSPVACPSADLNGDCFVDSDDFALMAIQWPATDFNDVAVMSNQWLTTDPCIPDDMAYIPDGTFDMGDSLGEGDSDELPVHTVTLDWFFMGKYEITNQQYCDYLNSALAQGLITVTSGVVYQAGASYAYSDTHNSHSKSQIDYNDVSETFSVRTKGEPPRDMSDHPMVMVTWYGAAAYCNWRSRQEGKEQCYNLSTGACDFGKYGYRLATEAEWEYAARGGLSARRFPWGDTITHSQANYCSSSSYSYDISPTRGCHPIWNDGYEPYTSPVGSFAANGYGLYDMAGNVWEWCNDWFLSSYYSSSPTNNPTGPVTGSSRVLRGGGWNYFACSCRVASRFITPTRSDSDFGFRLVLDLAPARPQEPDGMVWVDINDPGVSGHEGFNGEMSKYETTNAQYCQFLNAALASGDIYVDSNIVYGSDGSNSGADFVDEVYYNLAGSGYTHNGATNGGAARINYTGSSFTIDSGFENHPVTYISWYGSTAFCNYYGWRLPTEWEWQAVADYNGSYTYGCGTSINNSIANYHNSTHPDGTTVAGSFGAYGYGLCDMAGNVWEWTSSIYAGSSRVLRGGSWGGIDGYCTVSDRFDSYPDRTDGSFGFRVCR